MAPPESILRKTNLQSFSVTREPITPRCYGCLKTKLSFATMFGACAVFMTGQRCTATVNLITTNHTDTSMYTDATFAHLAAGFWLWSLATLTLTCGQCHARYSIKTSLVKSSWALTHGCNRFVTSGSSEPLLHWLLSIHRIYSLCCSLKS